MQRKHSENVNYLPLLHHSVLLDHIFCEHIRPKVCHTSLLAVSVSQYLDFNNILAPVLILNGI